jgi:hypothetical protein
MDRFSTMAEVVSDKVQVNDNVKAIDGQWYTVTVVNPHIGMALAKRMDGDREVTATFYLIKD